LSSRLTPDPRPRLGLAGEAAAERFIRRAGWRLLARRFRTRAGEIDLVALDGDVVVFVEVKTRRADGYGRPAESVTRTKRERIVRVARIYLARTGWHERRCRFDVVEVVPRAGDFRVRHIEDAFRPCD
jgi:putative endonuclease